ncbi:MAG: translation elongation factor Ts [bacterium]
MANYTMQDIAELREQTGMGLSDIKNALEEAAGDRAKAMTFLKERGAKIMGKKADRDASEGVIEAYVHSGRIGVIVEVNCETDFVARGEAFKEFAHDLALQIASMAPENVEELLEQAFVKDSKLTIGEYLQDTTSKMGEKIVISRFTRYELGQSQGE